MTGILKSVYRKLKGLLKNDQKPQAYDFNKSNPLGGNGERVDIQLNKGIAYAGMDVYQKNHWKRYEYAKEVLSNDELCGDFACGTGYGSVFISDKVKAVVGADINLKVINEISERYKEIKNVKFLHADLLTLDFTDNFSSIISFETLEHFKEEDIASLLKIYNKALKQNGKLIFSTPYMQEKSEEAVKMGFHLSFYIDEVKVQQWLAKAGFEIVAIKYQNYDTHVIQDSLEKKEFIICVAKKVSNA